MYKDIVISLLGALLLEPVLGSTEVGEQIAIVMGLAAMLFIFCLFCEDQLEKMQKKQKRIRELEHKLEELRGGRTDERRESTTAYDTTGNGTGYAADDAG